MIAIDTNILVYAHRSAAAEHVGARRAIERAARQSDWGFAQTSLTEFWAVVTSRSPAGHPSSAAQATGYLTALRAAGATVMAPGPDFADRLLALARVLDTTGTRIFDLQIALSVMDHGVRELWTHDRDFVPVPGLRLVDPLV